MNLIGVTGKAGSGKDTAADFLVSNSGWVKIAFADEMKRICSRVYPFMTREHLWGPSSKRNEPIKAYPRKHGPWVNTTDIENRVEVRCACCSMKSMPKLDMTEPQCYLTARYALQKLGSEWGRDCYENTWVDFTLEVAKKLLLPWNENNYLFWYTPWDGLVRYDGIGHPPKETKGVVISDVRWPGSNEGKAIVAFGGHLMKTMRGEGLAGASGQHQSEKNMDVPDSVFKWLADNRTWEVVQLEAFMKEVASHPSFARP